MPDRSSQRHTYALLLFAVWGATIAWLSLTPSPPVLRQPLLGWDKFQHASAYALLTLLGGWAFGGTRRAFCGLFLLALVYGGSLELAQGYLTSYRSADWLDWVANLTGAGVVTLIAIIFIGRRKDIS